MDSWRRQRSDNYNQEATRTRSQNRKPPLGNWQPTVPAWEKKFCWVVGSVPWRKVLDSKKFIHLYDNVLKWNDSAGEEAFHNGKNRYWAELNGRPCDIPLPDPNAYIDDIDWDSEVDPQLLLDLENNFVVPEDSNKGVVILGEMFAATHGFSPSGWGDEEEFKKVKNLSLEDKGNSWEQNCAQANVVQDSGGGNGWNCDSGWNQWESKINEFGNHGDGNNDAGVWEPWGGNKRNRENSGRYMSRYKTTRFHGDDHVNHWERRNRNGRREDFVHDQRFMNKRSGSKEWNAINSCRPINHQWISQTG